MIKNFLDYIRVEKQHSPNTVKLYGYVLNEFSSFCSGVPIDLFHVERKHIQEYVCKLRERDLASRSIALHVTTIRQFYSWAIREEIVIRNPTEFVSVSFKKPKQEVMTQAEVKKLIEACVLPHQRAMLEFLYSTGCRVSEMLLLRIDATDLDSGTAKVLGKGGKERIVIMNDSTVEWMKKITPADSTYFFQPYTRQGVFVMIRKIAKRAGIKRKISPHTMRHSFATHVLRNGSDLITVKELMGHAAISSTEIYTHITNDEMIASHRKHHPRN